jgi:GT2 family glycosyltransferase
VLRSGKGTSICNIDKSIRTYWLNGGATIWKAEFLRRIEHKEINCRYAVFEDIIFSYPIGKEFPLYVCAEAQVIHDHEIHTGALTLAQFFYRGKTQALWQLYFVTQHKELSLFYYLAGYVFPNTLTLFLRMVKKKPSQSPFFHLGRIVGAITGLLALLRGTDFQAFLSEECSS